MKRKRKNTAPWRPVWALADERNGRPAVKIFVKDLPVQGLRLDRVVQLHEAGYAAYRPHEEEPFLIARDLNTACGMVTHGFISWEGSAP